VYDIPSRVISCDQKIDRLLKEVSFSRYLNPTNSDEVKHRFLHKKKSPVFSYNTFVKADEYLFYLDSCIPNDNHPLADLLTEKIHGLQLLIVALRDRTTKAFDELALQNNWYPSIEDLHIALPNQKNQDKMGSAIQHSAQEMIDTLRSALIKRGLEDWKIEKDSVMSARVLVDGAKKILRVHPHVRFRKNDLRRLVIHEIDVHVMRSHNGEQQQLTCFATSLPQSLLTEEGLAMIAEEKMGVLSYNSLKRQQDVVRAIYWGKELGFTELYQKLVQHCSSSLSWAICQRIKRGLAEPDKPGVYAKDSVYLRGWQNVTKWLSSGGNIDHLYVGKVGLHHPIEEWIEMGWLQPCKAPEFWQEVIET
jgi:hypothetical protein